MLGRSLRTIAIALAATALVTVDVETPGNVGESIGDLGGCYILA